MLVVSLRLVFIVDYAIEIERMNSNTDNFLVKNTVTFTYNCKRALSEIRKLHQGFGRKLRNAKKEVSRDHRDERWRRKKQNLGHRPCSHFSFLFQRISMI